MSKDVTPVRIDRETVQMALKVVRESKDDKLIPAWTPRDVEWARWVIDQSKVVPSARKLK